MASSLDHVIAKDEEFNKWQRDRIGFSDEDIVVLAERWRDTLGENEERIKAADNLARAIDHRRKKTRELRALVEMEAQQQRSDGGEPCECAECTARAHKAPRREKSERSDDGSAMFCEHANEVPSVCYCDDACYCVVQGTCKDRVKVPLAVIGNDYRHGRVERREECWCNDYRKEKAAQCPIHVKRTAPTLRVEKLEDTMTGVKLHAGSPTQPAYQTEEVDDTCVCAPHSDSRTRNCPVHPINPEVLEHVTRVDPFIKAAIADKVEEVTRPECVCNESFRTAEDYRDHLPCGRTITQTSPGGTSLSEVSAAIQHDLGQVAYDAYCAAEGLGWRPPFKELQPEYANRWTEAAKAVTAIILEHLNGKA